MAGVFLERYDGVYLGLGWSFGVLGLKQFLLKVVPSGQSVFLHNFLISQDRSLIKLRIALSIPELHESEDDLQKTGEVYGNIEILKTAHFMLGERSETGSSFHGSWVLWS